MMRVEEGSREEARKALLLESARHGDHDAASDLCAERAVDLIGARDARRLAERALEVAVAHERLCCSLLEQALYWHKQTAGSGDAAS